MGRARQKPFDIDYARTNCADWRATEARMGNAEAFLKTLQADVPEGRARRSRHDHADAATCNEARSRSPTSARSATPASSRRRRSPPTSPKPTRGTASPCSRPIFSSSNFLSDDRRYPVSQLGTNIARAAATNATADNVWGQFSSATYKKLPAIGRIQNLYNPRDPEKPIEFELGGGGRGYYRTPTLISMWATAPYLHNNALGTYIKDPSVRSRVLAFEDATEKLLWPERRLGVQSIGVTSIDTELRIPNRTRPLKVPAGTPVDLIARVDPREVPAIVQNRLVLNIVSDETLFRGLIRRNQAPDFVLDRGHVFGAELPDEDKRALIEFMKTF